MLLEHKTYVFFLASFMLSVSGVLAYLNRNAPCPIDPQLRDACIKGRRFSKIVLILGWFALVIGFFFAYLAQYLIS